MWNFPLKGRSVLNCYRYVQMVPYWGAQSPPGWGTHILPTLGISTLLDFYLSGKEKHYFNVRVKIYHLNWHLLTYEEGWITFFMLSNA